MLAAALLGASVAWWTAPRERPTALETVPQAADLTGLPATDPESARPVRPERRVVRVRTASLAAANRSGRESSAPTQVSLPRLSLSLPVRPGGTDRAGLMALPETVYALSWYRFGPGPLDGGGATVVAGHVDTRTEGTGPLARLAGARPGDDLTVFVGRTPVRYRVVAVERVANSVLDLSRLFARNGPPRLHLVTCGGAYVPEQGGYQDNVVVTALPLGRRSP